jgi:hypothetical protein
MPPEWLLELEQSKLSTKEFVAKKNAEEAKEEARREAIDGIAKEELGEAMELIEMGDRASMEQLMSELSVVDRIDGMIERCIKRLLLVRGAKSMSLSPVATPAAFRKRSAAKEAEVAHRLRGSTPEAVVGKTEWSCRKRRARQSALSKTALRK